MSKRIFILVAIVATVAWMAQDASANILSNEILSGNRFSGLSCGPDGTKNTTDDIIWEIEYKWQNGGAFGANIRSGRNNAYWAFRAPTGRSYDRGGGSHYGNTTCLLIGLETSGSSAEATTPGQEAVGLFWEPTGAGGDYYSSYQLIGASRLATTATTEVWHHITAKYLNTTAAGGDASATWDGQLVGEGQIDYSSVTGSTALHGPGFKGFGLVCRVVQGIVGNRYWDNLRINGGVNGVADDFDTDPVGIIVPGTPSWVIDQDSRPYAVIGGDNHLNVYGNSIYANIPSVDTTNAINLLSTDTAMPAFNSAVSMDFQFPTTCTDTIAITNAVTASLMARATGPYGAGDGASTHATAIQIRVRVANNVSTPTFLYEVIQLPSTTGAGVLKGATFGVPFDHSWHRVKGYFSNGFVTLQEDNMTILTVSGLDTGIAGTQVGVASSYTSLPQPDEAPLIDNVSVNDEVLDYGFNLETVRHHNTNNVWINGPALGLSPVYASDPTSWSLSLADSDFVSPILAVHGWEMY